MSQMDKRWLPWGARAVLAIACLLTLAPASRAAEFYAIVDNFGRRPLNAYLDAAVDGASGGLAAPEIHFNAWDWQGAQVADFVATTQDGFASTFSVVNLFDLANGQPLLVRAITPPIAADFGASLHLELRGTNVLIGVLPGLEVDGTPYGSGQVFAIPLGSFKKASLLIANVSGSDVGVESFRGLKRAPGTGTSLNGRLGSHASFRVDLTQNDAFSNYIVSSTGLIIVQVVIDDGKTIQSYMVPPSH
jgi:hypothetical protein